MELARPRFREEGKMVKFRAGELLGFGLSAENIRRLQQGEPIYIDLTEMGMTGKVLIFYGKTEFDMAEKLKPFVDKDTFIHETERYQEYKKGSE